MDTAQLQANKVRIATINFMHRLRAGMQQTGDNGQDMAAVLTRPWAESLAASICRDLGLPHAAHPWTDSVVEKRGKGR